MFNVTVQVAAQRCYAVSESIYPSQNMFSNANFNVCLFEAVSAATPYFVFLPSAQHFCPIVSSVYMVTTLAVRDVCMQYKAVSCASPILLKLAFVQGLSCVCGGGGKGAPTRRNPSLASISEARYSISNRSSVSRFNFLYPPVPFFIVTSKLVHPRF